MFLFLSPRFACIVFQAEEPHDGSETPATTVVVGPRGLGGDLTLMQKILKKYHDRMPGQVRRLFDEALTRCLVELEKTRFSVGTACSGSDIFFIMIEILLWDVAKRLGRRTLQVIHEFACERDDRKQKFLCQQFNPRFLFGDVEELGGLTGKDVKTGQRVYIPETQLFGAGFSCVSRTSLSSNCAKNRGCIQRQDLSTETAYTFAHNMAYIRRKLPLFVFLENVKGLCSVADGESQSDAQHIKGLLEELGYTVFLFVFDAADFGSIAARIRLYIIAFRVLPAGKVPRSTLSRWSQFHNYCTVPSEPYHEFLIFDLDKLEDTLAAWPAITEDKSAAPTGTFKWQDEHINAYRELQVYWPPILPEVGCCFDMGADVGGFLFWRGSLNERHCEMTIILMAKYPYTGWQNGAVEFCDVNPSLSRVLSHCSEDKGPWRPTIPTITGMGRPVVRYVHDGCLIVRPVTGVEAFKVIGWDLKYWYQPRCFSDELLLNLAGNAFTSYAALVMLMTLLGAYGSVLEYWDKHQPATDSVNSVEDVPGSQSSSSSIPS